jgi:hypothetical protein
MSTRSPQFGRAGSRERRPAAEDASTEERAKTRNDDINRSGGPAKSNDK